MPNAHETNANGPELPAETPSPEESSNSQPGLFGKISNAVSSVSEKHGLVFKRGRGRPRKDGTPGAGDKMVSEGGETLPAMGNPALAASVQPPSPASDFILHRTLIGAFKGALKALGKYCKKLAGDAGMQPDWISRNMSACEPEPELLADWSESAKAVLEKYNVKTEYSPEVALGINTVRLVAPFAVLIVELKKEIASQRAERGAGDDRNN